MFEAAEGLGMDNPVPISLESRPEKMGFLGAVSALASRAEKGSIG